MLNPAALLYRAGVSVRDFLYRKSAFKSQRLSGPVISVGNLTVGGSGKTPFVEYLGRTLLRRGVEGVILSRGYGGAAEKRNLIVSNGRDLLAGVTDAGDEPMLLARNLPGIAIVVGRQRYRSAELVDGWFDNPVFLLDDGFQHRQLLRDLDIVLVDATTSLEAARLLPAGRLREPVSALSRADAVVLTRAHLADDLERARREVQSACPLPVFSFRHRLVRPYRLSDQSPIGLNSGTVLAMAGIARPELFQADLEGAGLRVVELVAFADHHTFTRSEIDAVFRKRAASGADWIVTTEKDAVRLMNLDGIDLKRVAAFPLRMEPVDGDGFDEWFDGKLNELLQ